MIFFAIAAAAVAGYFAITAWQQRRVGAVIAAIVWLLYAAYEVMISDQCDGGCNIRADLVFIWPLLFVATLFGRRAPGQWARALTIVGGIILLFCVSSAALFAYVILVEGPSSERAAREKKCASQGAAGPDCPPATPSAVNPTAVK